MNGELDIVAQRILSALFNGVYQGISIALVLWLIFKLFRGLNATTRHAIGFVALLIVAALPVLHFAASSSLINEEEKSATLVEPPEISMNEGLVGLSGTVGEPMRFDVVAVRSEMGFQNREKLADDGLGARKNLRTREPEILTDTVERDENVQSLMARFTPVDLTRNISSRVSIAIVVGVLFVALWKLARLGAQFVCLIRLKRNGDLLNIETQDSFERVLNESSCQRTTRLVSSRKIHTPIAIGYFSPVVVIPANVIASSGPGELDAIIRHEVAHICRRDDWFNLIQQLIAAVCFFNPSIWWLSHRITIDRELACDDHALDRSSSPEDYALTLTEFAGRSQESHWIAAPAAWNTKSQLKERINMILDPKRNTSITLGKTSASVLAVVATAVAGAAFIAAPRLVLAQAAADTPHESSAQSSSDLFAPTTGAEPKTSHQTVSVYSTTPPRSATISAPVAPGVASTPSSRVRTRARSVSSLDVSPRAHVETSVRLQEPVLVSESVALPGIVVAQNSSTLGTAPIPPVKPNPPGLAVEPVSPLAPDLPMHPVPMETRNRSSSLEKRMEKLEQRIEELTASQAPGQSGFSQLYPVVADPADPEAGLAQWLNRFGHNQQKEIENAVKDANQHIARAMQQLELANKNVDQRVRKEVVRDMEVETQRAALNERKRVLEKQMRALEQQMEQLHEQFHSLEEQLHDVEEPSRGKWGNGTNEPDPFQSF